MTGGPVYLLEHACYKPPEEFKLVVNEVEEAGKHWPMYSDEVKDFMYKIFVKSGLGADTTYLPPAIHPCHVKEPNANMRTSMQEAEMVMTGALSELLERTGLQATDIDILVTCCSIFCPTPSLASMLVNKFKMRPDVQSYHLGGMGCGTGVVGINLCRDLLNAHPNSVCVFVPSEITTHCFYYGPDKHRMVANIIFRMGGAAVALTNKASMRPRAKYELLATSRVHTGADDDAYGCMSWSPDETGINGVYLGRNVVDCATVAITAALTEIAPKVLTWQQYGKAVLTTAQKKLGYQVEDYKPDWTKCCDHFALHAGGYAVLKGLQRGIGLPVEKTLPSFAGLREYGNTSCSTTWYSMAYIESWEGIKQGQRLLQLGVGGGMKAGVNVWRALRDLRIPHKAWAMLERPLTEADLPRGVSKGDIRDKKFAEIAELSAQASAVCEKARREHELEEHAG